MKVVSAEKSYYEISETLGEGLTGEVYKAFRRDSQNQTRQVVALKVLKSRKHVQILRQEFQKLQAVDSPYCIKLLGWENLSIGPALVLEYLEGLTLFELVRKTDLNEGVINEIVFQIQEGLKHLSRYKVAHGDLNPKNIFITIDGKVKLLDFGHFNDGETTMGSPQFMAPETWQGQQPTYKSDLFALGLLIEDLIHSNLTKHKGSEHWKSRLEKVYDKNSLLFKEPEKRKEVSVQTSRTHHRQLVKEVRRYYYEDKNKPFTQILHFKKPSLKLKRRAMGLAILPLLIFLFPKEESVHKGSGVIDIRSNRWMEISINGLPEMYTPVRLENLRAGKYNLRWKSDGKIGEKQIDVAKDSQFLLQLESSKIR